MSEEAAAAAADWVPTYPRIRRLDEIWAKAERWLCAAMFVAMGFMVFASVLAEIFGRRREWIDVVVLFGVVTLGVFTRARKEGERPVPVPIRLAIAAGITAGVAGLVWLYVREFPGGFIWAQKLSLVLMIWVALFGASIATYERSHLALEFGEKLWPEQARRFVKAAAHAITSAFCLACVAVSIKLILAQRAEGHAISPAVEWMPTWVAFLAMPYAFLGMGVRFLAQSWTTARQEAAPAEEQLPT